MLPKSISCGKTFRAQNVLTGLTAVHTWLLQLGQELQERIEADRAQHQRLPKLLTVSFDSAPLHDTAGGAAGAGAPAAGNGESEGGVNSAAAAAAAGGSSARSNGGGGGGGAAGPSHGRLNAHNWRAGVTNISRSCPLRHVKADAIAQDALLQVKKWARDRCGRCVCLRCAPRCVCVAMAALVPFGAYRLLSGAPRHMTQCQRLQL